MQTKACELVNRLAESDEPMGDLVVSLVLSGYNQASHAQFVDEIRSIVNRLISEFLVNQFIC